ETKMEGAGRGRGPWQDEETAKGDLDDVRRHAGDAAGSDPGRGLPIPGKTHRAEIAVGAGAGNASEKIGGAADPGDFGASDMGGTGGTLHAGSCGTNRRFHDAFERRPVRRCTAVGRAGVSRAAAECHRMGGQTRSEAESPDLLSARETHAALPHR